MSISISKSKENSSIISNKGFNRGQIIQAAVAAPASIASLGIIAGMRKVSQLSHSDSVSLSKAVQDGLKNSGLYEKGVRAYKMKEIALPKLKDIKITSFSDFFDSVVDLGDLIFGQSGSKKAMGALKEELSSNKLLKKLLDSKFLKNYGSEDILDSAVQKQAAMYRMGLNACYLPKVNKIITPSKSLQTSVFHEMGHALNNNGNVLLKGLQKMRPLAMILPGLIFITSILNKHQAKDDINPNDTKLRQGADFVKKHAGLLTGLSFVPMVLEEGLASLRGQGIAKKLVQDGKLSKEIFKKVKLTNLGGFASYALGAITAVAAAKAGIAVKDKIQAKYEAKKKAQIEG